jgi:acyl-CoA synthetase (NDP forming)
MSDPWKMASLKAIFEPSTIAVIGASDKPRKLGSLALRALHSSNYPGTIFLVNPSLNRIGKYKVYQQIQEINQPIDLALIAVQGLRVPEVLKECADKGIKGAVIYSAGFKELGDAGAILEKEIARIANDAEMGIIGPNCLGIGNIPYNLNGTFFPYPTPVSPGCVSLVSQSGGVAGLMLYAAVDAQLGIAKFASIGNRVNLDFADFIHYFGNDPETRIICLFVEGTDDARRMLEEAHQISPIKPILAYKVGKTPTAQRAALSHTGTLAGRGELYSSAFRQAGIQEVNCVRDLIDTAKALSIIHHLPRGNRVACVTHTLGPTIIAAEILEQEGIQLPLPSAQTIKSIHKAMKLPIQIPIHNPIDLLALGWARPDIFAEALRLAAAEEQYDACLTVFSPNFQEDIGGGTPTESLIEIAKESKKPIFAILNAPESYQHPEKEILEAGGIPVFASPERGAKALANVISYSIMKSKAQRS